MLKFLLWFEPSISDLIFYKITALIFAVILRYIPDSKRIEYIETTPQQVPKSLATTQHPGASPLKSQKLPSFHYHQPTATQLHQLKVNSKKSKKNKQNDWTNLEDILYPNLSIQSFPPPSTIIINKITMEGERTMRNTKVGEEQSSIINNQEEMSPWHYAIKAITLNLSKCEWFMFCQDEWFSLAAMKPFFPFPNCSFVVGCHKPSEQFCKPTRDR